MQAFRLRLKKIPKNFIASLLNLEKVVVSLPVVAEPTEASAEPAMRIGGSVFSIVVAIAVHFGFG